MYIYICTLALKKKKSPAYHCTPITNHQKSSNFHKRGKPRSIQFLHPAPSLEDDFHSIPLFEQDSVTVLLSHWTREYV